MIDRRSSGTPKKLKQKVCLLCSVSHVSSPHLQSPRSALTCLRRSTLSSVYNKAHSQTKKRPTLFRRKPKNRTREHGQPLTPLEDSIDTSLGNYVKMGQRASASNKKSCPNEWRMFFAVYVLRHSSVSNGWR